MRLTICLSVRKILLLLLLAQPVQASELKWDWNAFDYSLQGIFIATLVVDRAQTIDIASHGRERNPILGKSPSIGKINTYFLSCAVLHTGLMAIIPRPFRNPIQGFSILIESSVIHGNYEMGIMHRNYQLGYTMRF